jgi:nucleoside-diphosphate-sugar epimerase
MKVFLTGGTGFTGSFVLPRLLARGGQVRCLVRPQSDRSGLPTEADVFTGDLDDPKGLAHGMAGCEALVNTASLGFGHGPNVVAAAREAGVRRAVFISTTAVFTTLNAPSRAVRLAAEEAIQASGLDWTILRPTMIYGTARDRNICRLIRYLRRMPFLPVFGDGRRLMQPIHVADLAEAIVRVLETPETVGRAYNLSGLAPIPFNELIDTTARALGRSVWRMHLPAGPLAAVLTRLEKAGIRMPIKAEQILRLTEDKAFDHSDAVRDFGFAPRGFTEGVRDEVRAMGLGR